MSITQTTISTKTVSPPPAVPKKSEAEQVFILAVEEAKKTPGWTFPGFWFIPEFSMSGGGTKEVNGETSITRKGLNHLSSVCENSA